MSYAFGKVRQPEMVLKDIQLMAIQHIYNEKDVFVHLPNMASCYMVLPFAFEKAEVAYGRHRLAIVPWLRTV